MSKVRDLPPVSGSIIWARQVSTTWLYCNLTYKLYDVYISSKARAKVRVIILSNLYNKWNIAGSLGR